MTTTMKRVVAAVVAAIGISILGLAAAGMLTSSTSAFAGTCQGVVTAPAQGNSAHASQAAGSSTSAGTAGPPPPGTPVSPPIPVGSPSPTSGTVAASSESPLVNTN